MKKSLLAVLPVLILAVVGALLAAEQRTLYDARSEFNDRILVTEGPPGVRTLWFEEDGSRQSVVKLGDPDFLQLRYARAMPFGLAVYGMDQPRRLDQARVLIVGLGGGTIPQFLHKHFPKMQIDVVDIDPKVVEVATRFFGFQENEQVQVHVADGRKFVEQHNRAGQTYDIVFLDAFGPDSIPYSLTTIEFLKSVRSAVGRDGVVVANVWDRYSNSDYDSMIRTYQRVFTELYIVDVVGTGNVILVASGAARHITHTKASQIAAAVARQYGFPFELAGIVKDGFRRPGTDGRDGQILRDADRKLRE